MYGLRKLETCKAKFTFKSHAIHMLFHFPVTSKQEL